MKQHILKTHLVPFQAIWDRKKKAELRVDDGRDFKVDDQLYLKELDEENGIFSGRELIVLVTHITVANTWIHWLPSDEKWVVMSFEELYREDHRELAKLEKRPEEGGIRRK